MYLFLKYTVLIILSYQCVTIYSIDYEELKDYPSYDEPKPAEIHCVIPFPTEQKYFIPIPYQKNITGAAIITPDQGGHLFIAHDKHFQFSCSGGTFVSPPDCVGKSEVTVKCVNGYTLSYNGEEHDFDMFRCSALPKAKLTAANASCNGIVNGVFNVGFYTKEPLNLYKVCFDTKIKRTLYSWTYLNLPSFDGIQWSTTLPKFVKTENFKSFNMVDVYNHKGQSESKTIDENSMTINNVMNKTIGHYLIPGHLLIENQFVYSFQQFATYFYENTAPIWSAFSKGVWKNVDKLFLRILSKYSGKHLIAAGTINSTHLTPPTTDPNKPFDVQWLDGIPVPHSIWRMIYFVKNKKGIVFIGLNTPFMRDDPTRRFCVKTSCPGRLKRPNPDMDLVYCCTKESFEKAYGPLDPVMFKTF